MHKTSSDTGKGSTAGTRSRQAARPQAFAEPVGPADDALEAQAHRVAEAVQRGGPSAAGGMGWSAASLPGGETIRRAAKGPQEKAQAPAPEAQASAAAQAPAKAGNLLSEDDADVVGGQMRKSEFMAALRSEICEAVDGALSGTGRDSDGCPWIDHWLDYYRERSASQIELSIRRYAPEARGAANAQAYLRMVAARVRQSASTWARTGQITGVPKDLPASAMPGGDLLSGFGGMFFKARPGGPNAAGGAASIHEQLGEGQQLPAQVRSRMEPVFGADFSGVRLHADATGARLSENLNAHAFTVGRHVAFGAGEYRPGTPAGDALIAHELAHVVQQGGSASTGPMTKSPDAGGRLEADADRSAIAVVQSLWDGTRDSTGRVRAQAAPRIRSGLRLSRCGKSERQKEIDRLGGLQYGFLEDKRKAEEARVRKEAEEDAKKKGLPPPVVEPKVDLADAVKKDVDQYALKGGPTAEWDNADQPKWRAKAATVWSNVVASVKGTELEAVVKGVTFDFNPAAALTGGFYAQQDGHTLRVGMSWVRFAEQDPKNVWENLAHEMAGHFKYGTTYGSEIMTAALASLSDADRKRVRGDNQKFFETYEYPETEIYAALWQRRYRVPEVGNARPSGGIHPDDNIDIRLNVMKSALHPEVAKAVLVELKRRVDANPEILKRDKDLFVVRVKTIMGISL